MCCTVLYTMLYSTAHSTVVCCTMLYIVHCAVLNLVLDPVFSETWDVNHINHIKYSKYIKYIKYVSTTV